MTRPRVLAAAAVAGVLSVATALPILAATATLVLSPQSGTVNSAFAATYTFTGSHCGNELLEIRWGSTSGKLLQQVAYPPHCGSVVVGGLYPPAGTAPAQYSVWGRLILSGVAVSGTEASAVYTVKPSPPPPSPTPTPPPPPTASAAPPTRAPTAAASARTTTALAPRTSAPRSSSAVGAATSAAAGPSQGATVARPGASTAHGDSNALPPMLLATERWMVRSPLLALAAAIVLVAAVTWWVYGTPMPKRLAPQQSAPVATPTEPPGTSVDPEPAPAREIYRAVPSTRYVSSAPPAPAPPSPGPPVWNSPSAGSAAQSTESPAPAAPTSSPLERTPDGLPPMAPPPPAG